MNLLRTKSIEQSIADADEPGRKLKRSLSTWDLMIMGVAVAVGKLHDGARTTSSDQSIFCEDAVAGAHGQPREA